jgi:hypothetical protein
MSLQLVVGSGMDSLADVQAYLETQSPADAGITALHNEMARTLAWFIHRNG